MGTKCIISLGIYFISCFCQVLSTFITEPCGSVQPIYGMVVKRHVFQTMKTSSSFQCSKACDNEVRCQSFNYVVTKEICELNNRTRSARPEDLVQDKDGLYMKRFNKRGRYVTFIQWQALCVCRCLKNEICCGNTKGGRLIVSGDVPSSHEHSAILMSTVRSKNIFFIFIFLKCINKNSTIFHYQKTYRLFRHFI